MQHSAVCCDGRTVHRIPSEVLFKYHIDELEESFMSCMYDPKEAYNVYLKWIDVYFTPDGFTVHRCFTHNEMHKYLVQETGDFFYSSHKNIYEAYIDPDKSLYQFILAQRQASV